MSNIKIKTLALISTVLLNSTINAAVLPEEITIKNSVLRLIPAGDFVMGSDKTPDPKLQAEFGSINPWYMDEHPQHNVSLKAFYMNKYEITNAQYRNFVKRASYGPPDSWIASGYIVSMKLDRLKAVSVENLRSIAVDKFFIDADTRKLDKAQMLELIEKHFQKMDNVPVTDVDWFGAQAYCTWMGATLPTEAQWEKANRGAAGKEFPWGNEFESGLSNTGDEDWPLGVTTGGSYKADVSDFGIYDLAGNVTEWVFDWYDAYPKSDFESDKFGKQFKVVRGAGWGGNGHYALHMYQRGAYRFYQSPDAVLHDIGFRCAAQTDIASK